VKTAAAAKKIVTGLGSKTITALEVLTLETKRASVQLLEDQLRATRTALAGTEADLMTRLRAGARVRGPLGLTVTTAKGRRRPEWKDLYLAHMLRGHGKNAEVLEAQVRARTPVPTEKVLTITQKES
jgi:hypothetical protein